MVLQTERQNSNGESNHENSNYKHSATKFYAPSKLASDREAGQPSSQAENESLVRILFEGLEKDPDFKLVAEKWAGLSEELRRAVVKMVR